MFTVRAPNRSHNGITAGVSFKAGVGHTDSSVALAYFRKAGYAIEPERPLEFTEVHVWTEEQEALAASLPAPEGVTFSTNAGDSPESPFAPGEPAATVPRETAAVKKSTPRRSRRK